MIIAAYQPYFAPFPGFFAKACLADALVLYDTVQFPNRTSWLTRNRFKGPQGELWMTIPVLRRGRGPQRIADVLIRREGAWPRKHLESLKAAYRQAPFFEENLPVLEGVLRAVPERLLEVSLPLIRHLAERLGCGARIVLLSELGIQAREPELSVAVARRLGARVFLAHRPAGKYLDPARFAAAGIELRTFAYHPLPYPQLYGTGILNLSAFDLLFCCGPKAPELLRRWVREPRPGAADGRPAAP